MSKKMCPKQKLKPNQKSSTNALSSILQYDPPVYKENGAGSYIEFRAFDPISGTLKRKTIKLNHIDGLTIRRRYAKDLIKRLNDKLSYGWNPWITSSVEGLSLFSSALDKYESFIDKMFNDGLYRKETYVGYKSYIKILREYNEQRAKITYLYQFDKPYCSRFLDYVFIDRECGAQTRNNYLGFLRVFSGYLLDKGLIDHRPTDGIPPISKRLYHKERSIIPKDKLTDITAYLKGKDQFFLVACYLLFYCFIRPAEMVRLKIRDIDILKSTVTITADNAKNHKTQTVSVPKKVIHYMIDLKIFSSPMSDYLFSLGLKPGRTPIDTKIFRDHWGKLRKALKLDKSWKFYSLKDTGITEMCNNNMATISVRDQARHSSLAVTDIYASKEAKVNAAILEYDGSL